MKVKTKFQVTSYISRHGGYTYNRTLCDCDHFYEANRLRRKLIKAARRTHSGRYYFIVKRGHIIVG